MANLRLNGVRYHYLVEGKGAPLLLLHGFTGSQLNWEPHVSLLSGDFKMIRIDLLGHGQTAAPQDSARYSMEKSAEDIKTLFGKLDMGPVNLLGYSMGGRLALYLALTYPSLISRLILESASPGLRNQNERRERIIRDERLATTIEHEGIAAFVDRWERLALFASQNSLAAPVREDLRRQRLSNNPTGLANSLRGMGTGVQPSLWRRLGELKVPTLLLAGALDAKFVDLAGKMDRLARSASRKIIPEAGHTIHLERPKLFAELVKQFLGHK